MMFMLLFIVYYCLSAELITSPFALKKGLDDGFVDPNLALDAYAAPAAL